MLIRNYCRHWFHCIRTSAAFERTHCGIYGTSLKQCSPIRTTSSNAGICKENPLSDLAAEISDEILTDKELVFNPDLTQVSAAQPFFRPSGRTGDKILPAKGVVNYEDLAVTDIPEISFVGRSNAGKSSLIKSLFFEPQGVRISVSKKPGHTRVVKLYRLGKFSLVDMPGYGENMPDHYVKSVEGYLKNRKNLVRTFLLIGADEGITKYDLTGFEMIEEFGIPYCVVFTKIDTCSHSKMFRNVMSFKEYSSKHLKYCLPQPYLTSSQTQDGVAFLRTFIAYVTGNLKLRIVSSKN